MGNNYTWRKRKTCNDIASSQWVNGAIPEAEGLGLLNLVKEINKNKKYLARGDFVIYSDNKKATNSVLNEVDEERKCVQEASATIESAKRETDKSIIEVNIEHSNNKPHPDEEFQQEPGLFF